MPLPFTSETIRTILYVIATLLSTVIIDTLLRSLIKVPKHFDTRRAQTYATIVRNIITITIYIIAFYIILVVLGINITPLLASAGIIGLTVGIGARALVEDLIGGLFLLSQNAIAIGDYVEIDSTAGIIESIGFRTLTIRTDGGALAIIPNGQVKKVLNFSRHRAHVMIDIPVKSDQDIDKTLTAAKAALAHLEKDKDFATALYPGATVEGIDEFKVGGQFILRVRIITYPDRHLEVSRQFRYLVKKEFEKQKIDLG